MKEEAKRTTCQAADKKGEENRALLRAIYEDPLEHSPGETTALIARSPNETDSKNLPSNAEITSLHKNVPVEFFRKATRELSEQSSCNFNRFEIVEDPSIFGM